MSKKFKINISCKQKDILKKIRKKKDHWKRMKWQIIYSLQADLRYAEVISKQFGVSVAFVGNAVKEYNKKGKESFDNVGRGKHRKRFYMDYNQEVKLLSNYTEAESNGEITTVKDIRIYRFLKDFNFDYMKVSSLLLSFFSSKNYVVAMDRTSWKFGKSDINILFLVMVIGKMSVPIFWKTLSHGGGCSAEFMKEFLQKSINNFGVERIKYLFADREFMNKEWLDFLINNHLKFAIPLKMDHKIRLTKGLRTLTIERMFSDVKALEYRACSGVLWNRKVNFTAYRNDKSELMVLVSSIEIEQDVFALYKFRWSVEQLFLHLKSGGFDIEKSHIVNLDRFEKLLVIAAIASALIVKNGLIQNALNPIRIKRHKTIEKQLFSLFTYGFDHIKNAFYQSTTAITQLISTLLIPPKQELFPILLPSLQKL